MDRNELIHNLTTHCGVSMADAVKQADKNDAWIADFATGLILCPDVRPDVKMRAGQTLVELGVRDG